MLRQEYTMTGTGPAILSQTAIDESPESEVVDTRFGKVTLYRKSPIVFPNGLLGMPDRFQFCLTSFPGEKLARFKLLQSLEDMNLSFIMLPVEVDNELIERADIEQACKDLDMATESLALLLIVTVQREAGNVLLSVNARAPIFMNVQKRVAAQYVFHNAKYQIRQPIAV